MKKIILALTTVLLIGGVANAQTIGKREARKAAKAAAKAAKIEVPAVVEDVVAPPAVVAPKVAAPVVSPAPVAPAVATPVQAAEVKNPDDFIKFDVVNYDFKTLPEGPQATAVFTFKNISNEPIELQNVQASCGCTVPEWPKEAVAPGKSATIKAIYNTQGRPGQFTKNLTVSTKQGFSKVITIKGVVEKAPATSVPAGDNMMIKK